MLCLAPTGIAASNLPGGKTIHSAFNFSIKMKMNEFLPDMNIDQLNRLRHQINISSLALVIIDELSYLSPELLAQVDNRLRQLMSNPETPYGGVSIITMGDFYQLPPVKGRSLFSSAWKLYGLNQQLNKDGVENPLSRGTMLFSKLQKFDLKQQMRAAEDVSHTEFLNQIRDPKNGQDRIDKTKVQALKPITSTDFQQDPQWLKASLVVTSNKERYLINNLRSKHWAVKTRTPRFVWHYPLCGYLAAKTHTLAHNYIYANYPEYRGCFVAGAPGYLTENINTSRELSNGTPIIYHSMTLNPKEDIERIENLINNDSMDDIELLYPPSYIHVVVPEAKLEDFEK